MMAGGSVLFCTILVLMAIPPSALALNFLIMSGIGTPWSHFKVASIIADTLVSRGHQVTFLVNEFYSYRLNATQTEFVKFEYFHQSTPQIYIRAELEALGAASLKGQQASLFQILKASLRSAKFPREMFFAGDCDSALSSRPLMERLRAAKFDMVIGEVMSPCIILIAQKLDLRYINLQPGFAIPMVHSRLSGSPSHPAFVPGYLTRYSDDMNFFQRCTNLLAYGLKVFLNDNVDLKQFQDLKVKHGIKPEMSVLESLGRSELWIVNSYFNTIYPRAFTPNVVLIGGLTTTPAKQLKPGFKTFVEGSDDSGVVVFAFSSYIKFQKMDPAIGNEIAAALARLPQRVVWKYSGEPPSALGNNTLLAEWLHLNDLLGHPKTRLLITCGGMNSVNEAIYHGVPMVGIALLADQFAIMNRIEKLGIAKQIAITDLKEETLFRAAVEVMGNSRYKENVMKWSGIMRDQPTPPREQAAHWVEHVTKYGGDYLRPKSLDLNFFQLHSLDVLLFLAVVLLLGLLATYYTLLITCRLICCRASNGGKIKKE